MAFEHFESAVRTDIGRSRKDNEDAVLALPEHGVFCVADGIGGAAGGAMASGAVIDAVRNAFTEKARPDAETLDGNIATFRAAVAQADARIKAWAEQRSSAGTGTTVVAFVFDPACSFFGAVLHAGDSRAYRFRQGLLTRLSNDHSVANALGLENEEDVPSAYHGVITHAIGTPETTLEENTFDVEDGDLFLLCSDGLTRTVTDIELEALLYRHRDEAPTALAERLVERANAAGGPDNISVVLVRVAGGELFPPAPEAPPPARTPVRRVPSFTPPSPPPRPRPTAERSAPPPTPAAAPPVEQTGAVEPPPAPKPPASSAAPRPASPPASPSTPKASAAPRPASPRSPSGVLSRRRPRMIAGMLLAGLLILGGLHLARRSFMAARSPAPDRASTPADAANGPAKEAMLRTTIAAAQRLLEDTLESGEWGTLKLTRVEDLADADRALERGAFDVRGDAGADAAGTISYDEIYRSWLYLWEKVRHANAPLTNRTEYLEYGRAMQEVQRQLGGSPPLEVRRNWPEKRVEQANFVCRESYRLQRIVLEEVAARLEAYNVQLSVFRKDRAQILKVLCALGTREAGCVERMGSAIVTAESRILALQKWIGMRGVFPLDPEVLGEIAQTSLPDIATAVGRVGALLRANLEALSADTFHEACDGDAPAEREIQNILLLRDRLIDAPAAESAAEWFEGVNVEQLGFFLQRLVRKCPSA